MKNLKIFLIVLITFIFVSCGSLTITSDTHQRYNNYDMFYDVYSYNQIHLLYLANPRYFYNNNYIDKYGRLRYGHNHPSYLRYCKEKRIRLNVRNTPRINKRKNHGTRSVLVRTPNRVRKISKRVQPQTRKVSKMRRARKL